MTVTEIQNQILQYLKDHAQHSSAAPVASSDFVTECLLDSFAILGLIMDLETRYEIRFDPLELTSDSARTAEGLAAIVDRKRATQES